MREQLAGYHDLVSGNEIFLNRVKGVGIYSAEEAISYSLSGANLRCTGVNWDLRRDEPYSIYDRFDFDIPVGSVGDAWDRYVCRMKEIEESLKLSSKQSSSSRKKEQYLRKYRKLLRLLKGKHSSV